MAKSGIYLISYSVNLPGGQGNFMQIGVNGTDDPSSRVPFQTNVGCFQGQVVLQLTAGDVIRLVNHGSATTFLCTSPDVGASISTLQLY